MKNLSFTFLLSGFVLTGMAQSEINPKIKGDKDKQFVTAELGKAPDVARHGFIGP